MVRAQTHRRFSVARPATPGQDQSSRTRGLIAPAQPANLPFAELQPLSRLKTPQSAFNDRLDDLGPDRVRACVSCSAHVHSSFASGRRFTRACALQPGEESDIPNESPLNNAFWPSLASGDGCSLSDRGEQSDENEGVKKPQLPEDHPQVVACAAQHGVHRIAERAL